MAHLTLRIEDDIRSTEQEDYLEHIVVRADYQPCGTQERAANGKRPNRITHDHQHENRGHADQQRGFDGDAEPERRAREREEQRIFG